MWNSKFRQQYYAFTNSTNMKGMSCIDASHQYTFKKYQTYHLVCRPVSFISTPAEYSNIALACWEHMLSEQRIIMTLLQKNVNLNVFADCILKWGPVLLNFCEGNKAVKCGFPSQGPVMRSFDTFVAISLKKFSIKYRGTGKHRRLDAYVTSL